MPFVDVQTSHGSISFKYTISTPHSGSTSAKKLDSSLPTVLFLHPVYIAQILFHGQFSDPQLRRFNLVALDLLGQGQTVGVPPTKYGKEEAADDIAKFMEALDLPSCYIFALSMGTIIGLQLAVSHPQCVKGLFLVSPLGLEEPEDVAEGRKEINTLWKEAFDGDKIDADTLADSITGALQLGFNNAQSPFINAVVEYTKPEIMKNYGSPQNFDALDTITLKIFTERKRQTTAALQEMKCPVSLVHCMEDVAYPLEYTEKFYNQLKDAGVHVSLSKIEGAPHFGCITHPELANPIFHDFVLENEKGTTIPPAIPEVISPYQADLEKHGLLDDSDGSSE